MNSAVANTTPRQREAICRAVALKYGLTFPKDQDRSLHEMAWEQLHGERDELQAFVRGVLTAINGKEEKETRDELIANEHALDRAEILGREIMERSRSGKLGPRRIALGDGAHEAIVRSEWRTKDGQPVPVLRRDERVADCITFGARDRAYPGLTMGRLLRAYLFGAKDDEMALRALSEGTNAAGGFTVNPELSAQIIDRMRAKSRVVQAGAVTVPLTTLETKIARISGDPTAAWHTENAQETDSDITFEQVTFTARTLMAIVRSSRELLEDSVNAEEAVMLAISAAMANELDRVALYGTGVAPQPSGLATFSGVNSVLVSTTLSNYDPIVDGVQKILESNANFPTAGILNPRTLTTFAKLKDTTNQPLFKPPLIENLPLLETTRVSADEGGSPAGTSIWLGDWPEMMIGVRSELRVEMLRERFADFHQFGFVAHLRADIQLRHAASFCRVQGINF